MNTLIIDNYDSFTFNLYQLLWDVTGKSPIVAVNDGISWDEVIALNPDAVVISPGPGRPENKRDFGICRRIILELDTPILGVCLGHQGIADCFGGTVVHSPEPYHGRLSRLRHNESGLFRGLPQDFDVVRYHSLMVAKPLPASLNETAWTEDGLLMGLRHRAKPIWATQFHPESIATQYGKQIIANFWAMSRRYRAGARGNRHRSSGLELPKAALQRTAKREDEEDRALRRVRYRKLDCFPDPERVFNSLWPGDSPAFWLDSSLVKPGLSRFSFMGGGASMLLACGDSVAQQVELRKEGRTWTLDRPVLDFVEEKLREARCDSVDLPFEFDGGFVGYLGYELRRECGADTKYSSDYPDAALFFADRFIAFDHQERATYLVALAASEADGELDAWMRETERHLRHQTPPSIAPAQVSEQPIIFHLEQDQENYLEDIKAAQSAIGEGESYEVCLTNRLRAKVTTDPLAIYLALRRISPAPYSAFLRFPHFAVACSSPERFLRIDKSGFVESRPIKGTSPRGTTTQDDTALADGLRNSEKNRSENLMIVDLVRNDLGRVCELGSVHVPRLMEIETYSTVHQLVSTIRGRLRQGVTAVDCIRGTFPGGSMTGAPKLRTMEIIDRLESSARGIYSGAIGFLGANGSADLNIVIRTAVCRRGEVSVGVGGAIVALSEPQEEFDEILLKARGILLALEECTGQPCMIEGRRKEEDGAAVFKVAAVSKGPSAD